MRRRVTALTLAGVLSFAAACSSGGSHTSSTASVSPATITPSSTARRAGCRAPERHDTTVEYAAPDGAAKRFTSLDLYLPATPACAPVFVFVHGGGYCCGDKDNDIPGPAAWLTRNGWIVASVNYRLHVRYPAFVDDVARAIAYLRAHVAEWGGDPSHIVLAGHSTGAEMVALVGTDPGILRSAGESPGALRCVLVLDAAVLDVPSLMARGGGISLYTDAFGRDPAVWRAASAIDHAEQGSAGVHDWLVVLRPGEKPLKLQLQQRFVAALRSHGATVTTVDASSIGHGQVIDDIGRAGDKVMTAPVARFLAGCAS